MAYADALRASTFTQSTLAGLVESIWSSSSQSPWQNWGPTWGGSGSLTYSSVTTYWARYMICGKYMFVNVRSTGTLGGTASNAITCTYPTGITGAVVSSVSRCGGVGWVCDNSTNIPAVVFAPAASLWVQKRDASNYTNSGTLEVCFSGMYIVS